MLDIDDLPAIRVLKLILPAAIRDQVDLPHPRPPSPRKALPGGRCQAGGALAPISGPKLVSPGTGDPPAFGTSKGGALAAMVLPGTGDPPGAFAGSALALIGHCSCCFACCFAWGRGPIESARVA